MNIKNIPTVDTAYEVVGSDCGRDKNGVFHCVCGMCRPLRKQSENRSDCGNNSSDRRNDTDNRANYEAVLFCPLP